MWKSAKLAEKDPLFEKYNGYNKNWCMVLPTEGKGGSDIDTAN